MPRSALQAIATNSGGQYFEITKAMIDAMPAGTPVPEVVRAVNIAVQHAFVAQTASTARRPRRCRSARPRSIR